VIRRSTADCPDSSPISARFVGREDVKVEVPGLQNKSWASSPPSVNAVPVEYVQPVLGKGADDESGSHQPRRLARDAAQLAENTRRPHS